MSYFYFFCASSRRFQEIFDLDKEGQDHEGVFLQWRHSMAKIKIYKRDNMHLCAICHRFRDMST